MANPSTGPIEVRHRPRGSLVAAIPMMGERGFRFSTGLLLAIQRAPSCVGRGISSNGVTGEGTPFNVEQIGQHGSRELEWQQGAS